MPAADDDFYDRLAPFVSLTLAQAETGQPKVRTEQLLKEITEILNEDGWVSNISSAGVRTFDGLRVGALRYQRSVQAPWINDPTVRNEEQHVLVAVMAKRVVGVHVSDPLLKSEFRKGLAAPAAGGTALSWLDAVPRSLLSAAFMDGGVARTLWLKGTHKRLATKADSKVLSGSDLNYALDPFDDRSFFWSAARSRNDLTKMVVGVSPNSSGVWARNAKTIGAFVADTKVLLDALATAATKKASDPFRILARPVGSVKPSALYGAYDLSILPPDLEPEAAEKKKDFEDAAAVILAYSLDADAGPKQDVLLEATRNGEKVGSFTLEVDVKVDGKASFKVSNAKLQKAELKDEFELLTELVRKGVGVNIRYDSGHSISDLHVFEQSDDWIDFEQYRAVDFLKYDVSKEKPKEPHTLADIGKEDSLFSWVQKTHSGWLACDDGANEKADFIHLDDEASPPVLTMIHAKGANSDSPARRISIAAYEIVTGQAVKNLKWLNSAGDLKKSLEASVRSGAAIQYWKDKAPAKRADFLAALNGLGDNFVRRVVVLQPHLRETSRQSALKAAKSSPTRQKLGQLNTLLASARRSCIGFGTDFEVIISI